MRAQAYDHPDYNPIRPYNGPGQAITNLYLSEATEHARLWLPRNSREWQSLDLLRPDVARQSLAERDVRIDRRGRHAIAKAAFVLCDLDAEPTVKFNFKAIQANQTLVVGRRPSLNFTALDSDYVAQQHLVIKTDDDGWLNLNATIAGDDSPIGLEVVSTDDNLIKFPDGPARYDYAEPLPWPDQDQVKFRQIVALAGVAQLGLLLSRHSSRR